MPVRAREKGPLEISGYTVAGVIALLYLRGLWLEKKARDARLEQAKAAAKAREGRNPGHIYDAIMVRGTLMKPAPGYCPQRPPADRHALVAGGGGLLPPAERRLNDS